MKNQIKYIIISLLFLLSTKPLFGEELNRIINFEGNWKFSIGDDTGYANPEYDDSNWDEVYVPSSWE